MGNQHEDLLDFLKLRLTDRADPQEIPEREILDALTEWMEASYPPPSITVTYHWDGSVTVARPQKEIP
jgi:hypothetical protein